MNAAAIIASDSWAEFPAIAAALAAIEQSDSAAAKSAARDALRKAELQRDIALGFTDLWSTAEREAAAALGLIEGGAI